MAVLGFHAGGRESDDGPLRTYIAKRTAGRTPEPVPSNALGATADPGERPRFVIQEHHASRLHWDFRLEHDGVFVSWAVPKGVPSTTARNNLAVMTEDHPLEYGTFEGTIPKGEYGGGTVTIWDDGRYELEKWRDDEVILTVEGRPGGPLGRVRLALIRTDGKGEKSTWLMHRMKTDAEGRPQADGEPVVPSEQADEGPGASGGGGVRGGAARARPTRCRRDVAGGATRMPRAVATRTNRAAMPPSRTGSRRCASAPLPSPRRTPPCARRRDARPTRSDARNARIADAGRRCRATVELARGGCVGRVQVGRHPLARRLGRRAAAPLRPPRQRHHRAVSGADAARRGALRRDIRRRRRRIGRAR